MKPEIERKTQLLLCEIQNSKHLSAEEKGDMQDMLLHAEAGTNGLSQEEKLQSVSETVYSIVSMMISKCLDRNDGKFAGLYKTIIECKWQVCIIVGVLCLALIFQPQLASVIVSLVP